MYEEQKNELLNCIENYEKRIDNLLDTLEWTKENTLKEHSSNQPICKREIYDKYNPLYPNSTEAKNSFKFDIKDLQQIFTSSDKWNLPENLTDFQIKFNREEKLSLYQYVIAKTGKLTEPELSISPLKDYEEDNYSSSKPMTFSEIVAMRRDIKRRRLKYRTTKTPPLSVTEELRHLIEIQMQAFTQYLNHKIKRTHKKESRQRSSPKLHKRKSNKKRKHKEHKEKKYKR